MSNVDLHRSYNCSIKFITNAASLSGFVWKSETIYDVDLRSTFLSKYNICVNKYKIIFTMW